MNKPFPTPTARSLLAHYLDLDTQSDARAAMRAAQAAADELTVEAVIALAQRNHPALALNMAVKLLANDFEQYRHHLKTYAVQCCAALDAEKARLKPVTLTTSVRLFQLATEIETARATLKNADRARQARIEKLIEAGLSVQEVEALCPAVNKGELIVQLAALEAELQSIEKFHRTYNEDDLPFGFKAAPQPTWGSSVYIPTEPA